MVVGCRPAGDATPSPSSTTTSVPSELGFVTPQVGECRGLVTREIIRAPSDVRVPASCDEPHGSETVFVGQLPAAVAEGPHAGADALSDSSPELRPILDECDEEYKRYVGVSRIGSDSVREANVSRAFFIPPVDDWARGARWIRCDVVTDPVNGVANRGTTERLRGILLQNPLPPAWRACYRDVVQPPKLSFDVLSSCDQPHAGEALLRFQVADPKVDALLSDQTALEDYARTGFNQACNDRVAAHLGLSTADLAARKEITVGLVALQVARWAAEPKRREVQCLAFTSQPTVGTLEGLGDQPLPRP